MRKTGIVLLLVSAVAVCAQQPPAEVELTSEPSHHQVLQNEYVRVFDVTVAPKASTLVHRHRNDYLFVTLGDADVINARTGASPASLKLKDGETRYTPGNFSHAAINQSERPFHNLTIELLKASTGVKNCAESCAMPVACASAPGKVCPTIERRISSDQWTVFDVAMPPGSTLDKHTHTKPHLVIAVSDLDLTQQVGGETGNAEVRHTKVPAGGYAWVPPGLTHTLVNSGATTARYVAVDFNAEQK